MEIFLSILFGMMAVFIALSLCLISVYLIAVIATHLMYKWFGDVR